MDHGAMERARQAGRMTGIDPWQGLDDELTLWAQSRRQAQFWWRDDDAVEPTPALDRLIKLAIETVPPALAVIPAKAHPALIFALGSVAGIAVMPHGFSHANHAPDGQKKAELGPHRPVTAMMAELRHGYDRLSLWTDREGLVTLLPVVVPPWNRIAVDLIPALAAGGFGGLSTYGMRRAGLALTQVNCHADPIDWHGTRGFAGDRPVLDTVIAHLQAKRLGQADPGEPTGLLTHHLIFDDESWNFTARFLRLVATHKGSALLTPRQVFASVPTGTIIWP